VGAGAAVRVVVSGVRVYMIGSTGEVAVVSLLSRPTSSYEASMSVVRSLGVGARVCVGCGILEMVNRRDLVQRGLPVGR
jgi:hypothetical protein